MALRLVRDNDPGRPATVRDNDPGRPATDLLGAYRAHLAACGSSPATVRVRLAAVEGLLTHACVEDPLALTREHVSAWLGRSIKPWTRITYWAGITAWSAWLREFDHDPTSDLTKGIPRPRTPMCV
jgi:hypothetical protein